MSAIVQVAKRDVPSARDNSPLNPPEYGDSAVLNLRHAFIPADNRRLAHLCGTLDEHLRQIEAALQVRIAHRGEHFQIDGDKPAVQRALSLLESLYARADRPIPAESLRLAIVEAAGDVAAPQAALDGAPTSELVLRTRRADLAARTPNQHQYLRQILSHDISFGLGPAGTGKTFLAVACAVDALERSSVQRIILTRPAVEAGERLGFLPGDLAQKVDPYLRPLYDALYDLMGFDRVTKAFDKGQLEIAPLAFMRGRTLNHAFVILDEAQNTTPEQMKMFLTRIGFGSKCVVTGDTSQIDLPRGMVSGLVDAQRVLDGVDGIAMTRFTRADVVRHPLVARIVQAYEERQARQDQSAPRPDERARTDGWRRDGRSEMDTDEAAPVMATSSSDASGVDVPAPSAGSRTRPTVGAAAGSAPKKAASTRSTSDLKKAGRSAPQAAAASRSREAAAPVPTKSASKAGSASKSAGPTTSGKAAAKAAAKSTAKSTAKSAAKSAKATASSKRTASAPAAKTASRKQTTAGSTKVKAPPAAQRKTSSAASASASRPRRSATGASARRSKTTAKGAV